MKNTDYTAMGRLLSAIKTNELIYWFRRVPFVKRFVNQNAYSNRNYKLTFRILSFLKEWGYRIVGHGILVSLFTLGADQISRLGYLINPAFSISSWQAAYLLIVFSYCMLIGNSNIAFEDSNDKWMLLDQFRASAYDYYWFSLKNKAIIRFAHGIIFASALLFNGYVVWGMGVIFVPLLCLGFHEGVRLRSYRLNHKKQSFLKGFLKLILTVLILGLLLYFIQNKHIVFGLWMMALIFGMIQFYRELRRLDVNVISGINRELKQRLKLSSDRKRELTELQAQNARIDEDVDVNESNTIVTSMHGFRMINRIFYTRHRRIWMKKLKITVKVIGFAGLIVLCIAIFALVADYEGVMTLKSEFENPLGLLRMVLFVLGFANFTETIIQAFYLNCDSALLHYPFYRRKEIIWKQYLSRLGTLVGLNLIPALLLCVIAIMLVILNIMTFNIYFVHFIFNICLFSIFITAFNLILYYLIQPYNQDMQIKSPLYNILSAGLYFAVYQVPTDFFTHIMNYNLIVIGVLIGFIGVSCLAIYLFGEKTFKLRRT